MLHLGRVDFRMQQSCDGCVMTTIEPITPERGQVPIRTLARHRPWDGAVWFGGWLIPLATGRIRVDDDVSAEPGQRR